MFEDHGSHADFLCDEDDTTTSAVPEYAISYLNSTHSSPTGLKMISVADVKQASADDDAFQDLTHTITDGFPDAHNLPTFVSSSAFGMTCGSMMV